MGSDTVNSSGLRGKLRRKKRAEFVDTRAGGSWASSGPTSPESADYSSAFPLAQRRWIRWIRWILEGNPRPRHADHLLCGPPEARRMADCSEHSG